MREQQAARIEALLKDLHERMELAGGGEFLLSQRNMCLEHRVNAAAFQYIKKQQVVEMVRPGVYKAGTGSSMLAAAVRIGLEELVSAVWTFIKDYEYKSAQKHIRRQLITDRAKHKNRKELEQSAQTEIGAAFYLLVRKPTGEELAIQAHSEADYYHAALQHAIDELQKMKGGAQ